MFASQKTTSFYFCPCFYKSFQDGKSIKDSFVYTQLLWEEVTCICRKCKDKLRFNIILKGELCDNFFNE